MWLLPVGRDQYIRDLSSNEQSCDPISMILGLPQTALNFDLNVNCEIDAAELVVLHDRPSTETACADHGNPRAMVRKRQKAKKTGKNSERAPSSAAK